MSVPQIGSTKKSMETYVSLNITGTFLQIVLQERRSPLPTIMRKWFDCEAWKPRNLTTRSWMKLYVFPPSTSMLRFWIVPLRHKVSVFELPDNHQEATILSLQFEEVWLNNRNTNELHQATCKSQRLYCIHTRWTLSQNLYRTKPGEADQLEREDLSSARATDLKGRTVLSACFGWILRVKPIAASIFAPSYKAPHLLQQERERDREGAKFLDPWFPRGVSSCTKSSPLFFRGYSDEHI